MSNLDDLKPIKHLRPFTKFCMTIGHLPSSYLVSLTYEEQLLWLCDFLANTVIPAVNNNGDTLKELQNLFIELQDYVNHYFDNLDVQNEINDKLDHMAVDGTLDLIINHQIFGDINNKLDFLQSNNTIIIGDSYAVGASNNQIIDSWAKILCENFLHLSSSDYHIFAQHGAGFASPRCRW